METQHIEEDLQHLSADSYKNFQVGGSGLNLIGPFAGVLNYGGNACGSQSYFAINCLILHQMV